MRNILFKWLMSGGGTSGVPNCGKPAREWSMTLGQPLIYAMQR
jgi:hypothetical protein